MPEAMWHIYLEINGSGRSLYKIVALIMLFIGGIATYTFVWDLGDVGIGLMTIFNIGMLYLMGGQALKPLSEYGKEKKTERDSNQNQQRELFFLKKRNNKKRSSYQNR